MKSIKASIVFRLVDNLNKEPIDDAIVVCKDKSFSCVKKENGYYVFTNIEKGTYVFTIQAKGFISQDYEVVVSEDDVNIITLPMQLSADNTLLKNMKKVIFVLKQKGKPLINQDLTIKVNTINPYFRVIEPISRGNNLMKLGIDFDQRLLYQEYCYDKKPNLSIYIKGYDHNQEAYILKDTYKSKIPEDGFLQPVWNLKSDNMGKIAFAINPIFFLKDNAEFSFVIEKKKINVSVESFLKDDIIEVEVK